MQGTSNFVSNVDTFLLSRQPYYLRNSVVLLIIRYKVVVKSDLIQIMNVYFPIFLLVIHFTVVTAYEFVKESKF